MEYKTADRPNWKRVKKHNFETAKVYCEFFTGIVTSYSLLEVDPPLHVHYEGHSICIADSKFTWIQHFPENEHYCITTVIDQYGSIVQTYIDICKEHGVTENGVPYFIDLYLDIVILPDGTTIVMDEDELMEAYKDKKITRTDYELAIQTSEQILLRIKNKNFSVLDVCKTHAKNWFTFKRFV